VCFLLFAASPLTLSEVRSMLPQGFTADLAGPADQAVLRALHPAARTGARLLLGACSCDLVLQRNGARDDERELRARYFASGMSRGDVIAALDGHRRGSRRFDSAADARAALAAFVAEHARNAGPTLYLLRFGLEPPDPPAPLRPPQRMRLAEVLADPDGWLIEDRPTLVLP
jgi:hypothetical protein